MEEQNNNQNNQVTPSIFLEEPRYGMGKKFLYVILVIIIAGAIAGFAFWNNSQVNKQNINDTLAEKEKINIMTNLRKSSDAGSLSDSEKEKVASDLRGVSQDLNVSREDKIEILNELRGN